MLQIVTDMCENQWLGIACTYEIVVGGDENHRKIERERETCNCAIRKAKTLHKDSEVWHPCCVLKTNGKVNSVRKHNYNCMLDDGIY